MKKKKGIEQMDVAEKIRYFRQQKGLSQEQFGKRAGIHEQSIRKYELGIRKPKIDAVKEDSRWPGDQCNRIYGY